MDAIGNRTVRWLVEFVSEKYADKEFIVFEDRLGNVKTYTYREFNDQVNRYASILLGLGVKRGDKVTVHA